MMVLCRDVINMLVLCCDVILMVVTFHDVIVQLCRQNVFVVFSLYIIAALFLIVCPKIMLIY